MMNTMEVGSQYETAENACVTTMRSQHAKRVTFPWLPPNPPVRPPGKFQPPPRGASVAHDPASIETVNQPSSPAPPTEELRQTGRNMAVALVNAAPADLALRDLDDGTLDHEQEGLVAGGRAARTSGRCRTRVARYGEDVKAAKAEPKDVKEMREHLKIMRKAIKENAKRLSCPLLTLSMHKEVQMKRVALAGDGHFYDLEAIQWHIQANLGRPLVSPITKRPMTMNVYFMKKGKKTLWTPGLCENPLPAVCDTRLSVVPPSPSA